MSVCMLTKRVSYGHFPLSSTDDKFDVTYWSKSEQFIKAKRSLQHTMVDA